MSDPLLFKWRHFEADIILCAVRWYLRYARWFNYLDTVRRFRASSCPVKKTEFIP